MLLKRGHQSKTVQLSISPRGQDEMAGKLPKQLSLSYLSRTMRQSVSWSNQTMVKLHYKLQSIRLPQIQNGSSLKHHTHTMAALCHVAASLQPELGFYLRKRKHGQLQKPVYFC